jgi:hypothetical protein
MNNQGEEGDQGTRKHHRTSLKDSDNGSQFAPPKNTGNSHNTTQRQVASLVNVQRCIDLGKLSCIWIVSIYVNFTKVVPNVRKVTYV